MTLTKEIRRKLEVDIYLPLTKIFPKEICQRLIFAVLILDRINEETVAKISPPPKDHDGIFTSEVFEALRDIEPFYVSEITDVLGHIKPRDWGYVYEVLQGMGLSDKRKKQGAHFTPPQLVDEVVRPTLGQLFRQFWESSSNIEEYISQLRAMTVCDPAMGGGVFLLRAAQEIATEMAWAAKYGLPRLEMIKDWEEPLLCEDTYGDKPPEEIKWEPYLAGVIENSIYGVDIDPISCDLGRWALWFLQGASPEIKLSSNIKTGDALLGLFWEDVDEAFAKALSPQNNPLKREDYGIITSFMEERECGYSLEEKKPKWAYDLAFIIRYVGYTSGSRGGRVNDLYQALFNQNAPKKKDAEIKDIIEDALQTLFDDPTSEDAQVFQQNLKDWIGAQEVLNVFHWELEFPHIFNKKDGFDAIVANPPFIGDRDLRGHLKSEDLVDYLANYFVPQKKTSDYSGFFFWRYDQITSERGVVGSFATNSIAQTSNRRYVVEPLIGGQQPKFIIFRCLSSEPWPEMSASVHYSLIFLARTAPAFKSFVRPVFLQDGYKLVPLLLGDDVTITSHLDLYPYRRLRRLLSNTNVRLQFEGLRPRGNFSVLSSPHESLELAFNRILLKERDALVALVNTRDLRSSEVPTPSDLAVDFYPVLKRENLHEEPPSVQERFLNKNYPYLISLLKAPDRTGVSLFEYRTQRLSSSTSDKMDRVYWWLFGNVRKNLRKAWRNHSELTVLPRAVKVWLPIALSRMTSYGAAVAPTSAVKVWNPDLDACIPVVQSIIFEMFTRRRSSTIKSDLRFTPTEVLPYFPWPWLPKFDGPRLTIGEPPEEMAESLSKAAEDLLAIRTSILEHPNEHGLTRAQVGGPTDLYNLYDSDPDGENPRKGAENLSIEALRQAHVDLFDAVLRAYGWDDIAERCTRQDWVFDHPWLDRTMRFVPPESIRAELFQRINDLNAERYELEREMIINFIVENLPDQGLTMTGFRETAPFSEMNITSDQFDEFMQWEVDERRENARVQKDGRYWRRRRSLDKR